MAQLMSIKRNLEVCPGNVSVPAIYHVSQGDKGTRIILGLMNNNENYTIPSGTTATIRGHRADGTLFTEITADVETTEIKFNLTEEMTEIPGKTECEAVMTDGGSNTTATTNFVIDVERSPASVGNIVPGTNAADTWLLNALKSNVMLYEYVSKATSKSFTLSDDAFCIFNMVTNSGTYSFLMAVWRAVGQSGTVYFHFNGSGKPAWLTVTTSADGITLSISDASTARDLRIGILVYNGTVTPVDES